MNFSVNPISSLKERKRQEGTVLGARNPTDYRILELMLERIHLIRRGVLSAQQVTLHLPIRYQMGKMKNGTKEKRKLRLKKAPLARRAPIGLPTIDSEGWFNALIQFILYIPGLAELFSFVPRSLSPIQEFIDQYYQDQQENRPVSSANGSLLYRFLSFKFPDFHFLELFQYFLLLLQPKWEVQPQLKETAIGEDLFVTQRFLKKQFFASSGDCYDLNAFIERRPDGEGVNYIAYVKVDGCWYQCDDERITQFRSDALALPLQRGSIAHYKKISCGSLFL